MADTPQSAFMRPGKLVPLLLVAVIVYFVTLIIWVPAGWVWSQAKAQITLPPQLQVQQVSGTLWTGAAGGDFAGKPFRLGWQLGWPSSFELPVNIDLRSAHSSLQGDVRVGWPLRVQLDAQGVVQVAEFDELIRQSGGAMLAGNVTVEQLSLRWADNRLHQARGLARWPGGGVSWPAGDRRETAEFPAMELSLQRQPEGILLTVAEQGQQEPAAEATILANGMLDMRVYKRLIDLAGQPWSGAAQPGDVVFRVQQPLLPGAHF